MDQSVGYLSFGHVMYFRLQKILIWIVILIRAIDASAFTSVSFAIGLKAKLPCSTDITGSIHVQWMDPSGTTLTFNEDVETGDSRFKINHAYLKEWNLEIDNVRRSDAGNYSCNIGPTPHIIKYVELVVVVAPSIVRPSGDSAYISVPLGNQITLTCEASGEPHPTITWSRSSTNNGSKIDLGVSGSALNISSVSIEDGGRYECQANNNVPPPAYGRITLNVLFAPEITVLFREMSQEEGGSTLMTCLIRANPVKDLYWENNGTRIQSSDRYQVKEWESGEHQTTLGMFIINLVQSDFGVYKCVAVNEFGKAEANISIHEHQSGRIRVTGFPKNTIARVGDVVLLECSIHNMNPGNSLSWKQILPNGKERMIFVSHPDETSGSSQKGRGKNETFKFDFTRYEIRGHYDLQIKRIDFGDSGTYVCDVSGFRNFSAEVTVVDRSLSCQINETVVTEGDHVLLTCSLTHRGLTPNWHVVWLHDEEPVSSFNEDVEGQMRHTLRFNASYPHSTGLYRCAVADNQLNYSATCRVELTVFSSKSSNASPGSSCGVYNNTSLFQHYASNTFVIVIASSVAVAVFIIYIITVCCLITYHRQEIAKYKIPKQKSPKRNGNLDVELAPLTSASPLPPS